MRIFLCLLLVTFLVPALNAQDIYPRMPHADVLHYRWELELTDDSNAIDGVAQVTVAFSDLSKPFQLNLLQKSGEFGMEVVSISANGQSKPVSFEDNLIQLQPVSDTTTYQIRYTGIAERGLVIDKTKYGARSFFGDNWPNLARHWLPGVDHPYDKASVEFVIIAPAHYDVVATGAKVEESYLDGNRKLTHYIEPSPVALKVATIGVTRFASKMLGISYGVPISAWVYPENREAGFYDYAMAIPVMDYFIENIGPYPFSKLANMQAKTQWGGLENAGTIAYNENSVDGKRTATGLIAHEIAHQWFGNSASEADWNHVWLSEGFATYFAILFMEHLQGTDVRMAESALDRDQIIAFYESNPSPIVDLSIKDPMKVLNTNSYQKGGWVLHMLRVQLGDELFWKAIQTYYARYMHSNAMTEDLKDVFEEVSGKDLDAYFEQWVFTAGYPELHVESRTKKGTVALKITQEQSELFAFPLEIGLKKDDGTMEIRSVKIQEKTHKAEWEVEGNVVEVVIDPHVNLLFKPVK